MVANAHIDPVWIWDWHEGMHEVLATFRAALDRLEEDRDLVFSASSSAFYEWVEQVDPAMFTRIRQAVESGSWALVGGQWVEPDCNIPSGESVCRQFLYGQRYLVSRFGFGASIGWNVDAFGHAASLPQILVKAGLRAYVMMRPDEKEKSIPSPLFEWVGSDGTAITTYRVPFSYATDAFGEEDMLQGPDVEAPPEFERAGHPTHVPLRRRQPRGRTDPSCSSNHPGDLRDDRWQGLFGRSLDVLRPHRQRATSRGQGRPSMARGRVLLGSRGHEAS